MGELGKTTDSCVLYGVPKIFFGLVVDGHMQLTPFPMCLQAVLNYMGQSTGYAEIMAASGAAFRQRWNENGWDMAAIDIRNTYHEHLKPFELAFRAAGRNYLIIEEPDKSKAKGAYLAHIKSELDCGRPLIALGVVGPPEACIVTGYMDDGERLLGWSLWQGGGPFGENLEIDGSGYFIRSNWWENTEAIMSIGEEMGTPASVKDILQNALTLMTEERVETYEGMCGAYYCGQAAYETWARTVEDDAGYTEDADMFTALVSHEDQECMLTEGRSVASAYIGSLAEKHPELASEFFDCARLLKAASECVVRMQEARGGQGAESTQGKFREREVRREIAAQIRQAAGHERDACATLKGIVDKL